MGKKSLLFQRIEENKRKNEGNFEIVPKEISEENAYTQLQNDMVKRARIDLFSKIIRKSFNRPYQDSDYDKFEFKMATHEIGMVYYDGKYLGGITIGMEFTNGSFNLVHNFLPKKDKTI